MREELKAAAEDDADANRPVELDQTRQGRLSRMDAMQAQQMAQAVARRRRDKLHRVEGALRRLGDDEFGDCFKCGQPIEEKRLAADPTITRCIDCTAE
nr:TraR/DksA C4-type zinc finger protein [Natronospira proteinivora]